MSKRLAEYTEQELLLELITRQKGKQGPFTVSYRTAPLERLIGIGRDHTIAIYYHQDDLDALTVLVTDARHQQTQVAYVEE